MAMLPFCNVGVELKPLYHMGAQLGGKVAFWDSRDEFGDTCLLVLKPEEGRSLAKALGPSWLVLMRRHGATVAGRSLIELVFRTIYQYRNAEVQLMTQTLGLPLSPLLRRARRGLPRSATSSRDRRLAPGSTGAHGSRRPASTRRAAGPSGDSCNGFSQSEQFKPNCPELLSGPLHGFIVPAGFLQPREASC